MGHQNQWKVCVSLDPEQLRNVFDLCLSALQTLVSSSPSLCSDTMNESKTFQVFEEGLTADIHTGTKYRHTQVTYHNS